MRIQNYLRESWLAAFGFVLGLSAMSSAHAYVEFQPNSHLAEQVAKEPYRILPRWEKFTFTADADFFKPAFLGSNLTSARYQYDYYHGNGYWLTTRAEFKPNERLALNLKVNFVHGTSSNGPTYFAIVYPMVGFSYYETLLGVHFEFRLSDSDRQTLGTGLFIEQKETEGGYFIARKDQLTAKVMIDGTGSFALDGGVVALDANLYQGFIGGTFLLQEHDTDFKPPQYSGTIYSKHDWNNGLGYGVEVGLGNSVYSSLIYAQWKSGYERFSFWLKPQYRHYGFQSLGSLPGHVQHNYVSYDQNDKPYTTLMNIFAYGDDVNTFSAQLNSEFVFSPFYRWYEELEPYYWQYARVPDQWGVMFRTGLKFYPFGDREDYFGVLIGNKFLSASTGIGNDRNYSLPTSPDLENKPLFIKQLYVMMNYTVKL